VTDASSVSIDSIVFAPGRCPLDVIGPVRRLHTIKTMANTVPNAAPSASDAPMLGTNTATTSATATSPSPSTPATCM
jgi:hypothetical protein